MNKFVKELRESFNEFDSSLSIAISVPSGSWSGQWFDYSTLKNYLNWIGCMTYDYHGTWTDHVGHNAPLYPAAGEQEGSVHQGIQYLLSRGIPSHQVLIGFPFYGREFNATALYGSSTGGNALDYYQIYPMISAGWIYHWDSVSKVPYLTNLTNTKIITYDDSTSISIKCNYTKDNNLGGAMIWALGGDLISGSQPLLKVVAENLISQNEINITPYTGGAPQDYSMVKIYPNPFNEFTSIKFSLLQASDIQLSVFDIRGCLVRQLVSGYERAGEHNFTFRSSGLSSGIYLCTLSARSSITSKKMILLK